MGRTKKYLSNTNSNKKRGFYRPIKRIKKQSASPSAKSIDEVISVKELSPESNKLKQENKEIKSKILSKKLSKVKKEEDISEKKLKKVERPDILKPKVLKKLKKPDDQNNLDKNLLASNEVSENVLTESEEEIDFSTHSEEEKTDLLAKELNYSKKKENEYEKELKKLEEKFVNERENLEKTIRELKKDLHRTDPIDHNKFFSISKELQEVVKEMDQLIENEQVYFEETNKEEVKIDSVKDIVGARTIDEISNKIAKENAEKEENKEVKKGLFSKIPNSVKVISLTLLVVSVIGGFAWFKLNKGTEVDQQLLQEYLPADANTSPAQESINKTETENQKAETLGSSDEKYSESQAEVPFSDTKWDTLRAPDFGIELNYPKNAVNVIKTDSSITFIRKTGYIFKIQIVETALNVTEYWKLIKSSSLNYKVKETSFREKEALFLELEDFSDYPGDKYLVKNGEFIYDVWYATYSKTLSDDDAKRIDIMLNSLKFVE